MQMPRGRLAAAGLRAGRAHAGLCHASSFGNENVTDGIGGGDDESAGVDGDFETQEQRSIDAVDDAHRRGGGTTAGRRRRSRQHSTTGFIVSKI